MEMSRLLTPAPEPRGPDQDIRLDRDARLLYCTRGVGKQHAGTRSPIRGTCTGWSKNSEKNSRIENCWRGYVHKGCPGNRETNL